MSDRPTRPAAENRGLDDLQAGMKFAGHRIESELGRGGMGVVYRARHLALDRDRALKLVARELASTERFRARFLHESRLAASVEHPNVIPVHHAGEELGRPYLSMRIVDGPDLGSLVDQAGPLNPERAGTILTQVAAGLDAAHDRGLIHRDVKPSNVLVEGDPGAEHAYVTDFGISRVADAGEGVEAEGGLLGTPDYVAPEQVGDASVDRRADVYSLAGVAYFVLTGEVPFPNRSEPATLVAQGKAARPRPSPAVPGLPAAVDDVIARAMAVDPASRYESAGRFAAELQSALGTTRGARPQSPTAFPRRRFVAVALALIAIAAVALLLTRDEDGAGPGGDERVAGTVANVIHLEARPAAIAMGVLKIWVANRNGTITGIDPGSGRIDPATDVGDGAQPVSIAVGFGSIWVVDRRRDALVRMDPDESKPPLVIPVGSSPADVAVGKQWLWVSNEGDGTVSRVDPSANAEAAVVEVGGAPSAIAYGSGKVWVADARGGSVMNIRETDGEEVGRSFDVGPRPIDLTVASGTAWVLDERDGFLLRIDPKAEDPVERSTEVGPAPSGVAATDGSVWVSNGGDATISRIDPEDRVRWARVSVGERPTGVVTGRGAVWALGAEGSQLTRVRPAP